MFRPDKKIGALSTFLEYLDELGTAGKRLRYFRGHSKSSYQLKPSIFRNSGWIGNEATMLKELILRCPDDFAGGLTTFQCLVKMQHYGLPTRLLDVTSNPLVALYFACEPHEKDDEDGEVIVFDYDVGEVKYFDSDTVTVVANLSRRPADFTIPDPVIFDPLDPEKSVEAFNSQDAIKLLLHDIGNDKPHFTPKVIRDDLGRVVCVKPLLDNPRIIRQEGAFLLFGCDKTKHQPAKLEDTTTVAKLSINRSKKKELLAELHKVGINRATLFPEIEHVANHIKQSYLVDGSEATSLTSLQAKVLDLLRDGAERTVRELASGLGVTVATASRIASALEEKGVAEVVDRDTKRCWKLVETFNIVDGVLKVPGDVRPGDVNA